MAYRIVTQDELDQVIMELLPQNAINVPNPISVIRQLQRSRLMCRSFQCDTLEHTNVTFAQTLAICSVLQNFLEQRRMYDPHSEMGYICEQNCLTATQFLLDFLQLDIIPRRHARSVQVLAVANNEQNLEGLEPEHIPRRPILRRRIEELRRTPEESESSESEEEVMEPLRQRRRVEEPIPQPVPEPPRQVIDLTGYESSDSDATQLLH